MAKFKYIISAFVVALILLAGYRQVKMAETMPDQNVFTQGHYPALATFCSDLQQLMASTSLSVKNEIHRDRISFVKSKASTEPLTTHQYLTELPLQDNPYFPSLISCKLKTSDNLRAVYGAQSAGEEKSCKDALAVMLLRAALEAGITDVSLRLDEDEVVRIGPQWLKPWPYQVAYVDEQAVVHLRSKSLMVPFLKWIPGPARFMGTHYCHLPTPQYLHALLVGDVIAKPIK